MKRAMLFGAALLPLWWYELAPGEALSNLRCLSFRTRRGG